MLIVFPFLNELQICCSAVDVERHARDFMEAAKKLQLYLIGLQREDLPSKVDMLRKVSLGNADDTYPKRQEKIQF